MNAVRIRTYEQADREDVLRLFHLNTPVYFSPDEEEALLFYLDKELEYYFVIEVNGVLAGCGGVNLANHGTEGKISWDIMHPEFQGLGLGRLLLNHRLNLLKSLPDIKEIGVRTSQLAFRFYEKAGFKLFEEVKDYWAPGLDLYAMRYTG